MDQLFNHFADLAALQKEKEDVRKIFKEIEDGIARLSSLGFKIESAKGIAELNSANKQLEKTQGELLATQKKLEEQEKKNIQLRTENIRLGKQAAAATDDQTKSQKAYTAEQTNTAETLLDLQKRLEAVRGSIAKIKGFGELVDKSPELKAELIDLIEQESRLGVEVQKTKKLLKDEQKEFIANANSIDEAKAKLAQYRQERDGLKLDTDAGKSRKEFLNKEIDALDEFVKANTDTLTKTKLNVGNYAQSLEPFFTALSEKIEKLKTEQTTLQNLSKNNPIGFKLAGGDDRLNQVNAELKQLNNTQEVGFKISGSYAQQVNTLDKSLNQMAQSGEVSTSSLTELNQALRGAKLPNYAGNFKGAFNVLVKELESIRQKLKDPALQGKELEKLQQEEKLLTQLTVNLTKEFTSTRDELRAMQETAKQVGINFGTTGELFLDFTSEVGEAKDQLTDIQNVINENASDTKYLDAAIGAAQGLAGAYGAVQGAMELAGGSSEDLQKKMVKLQAILTIINGLQSIQNVLQAESGVIQTILAAKVGLLNAAKAVQAALSTQNAVAVQAEAVAQAENAVATEAAAVAQVENIAVTEAATVAAEGQTVAVQTATVATRTWATALAATGIGAMIIGIAAGVVFLVKKINDWVLADSRAIERQNELGKAIKETNDNIIDQANLIGQTDNVTRRNLQSLLDLQTAGGTTQVKQFAIRKKIAEEDKRLAQQQVDFLGATNAQQTELLSSIESGKAKIGLLNKTLEKEVAAGKEDDAEATRKAIEGIQIDVDSKTALYNAGFEARQNLFAADKDLAQISLEEQKFNADERRKLILESTHIEVDLIKAKNDKILNDERSTLKQRIAAIKSSAEAQKRAIEAEKNNVLNDPTASDVDKSLAVKKAAADELKINLEKNQSIEKENESFRLRDLQAQRSILELRVRQEIESNKRVVADMHSSFDERLAAFKSYTQDEKALIDADFQLKLQQAGISDKEIEALKKNKDYKVKSKKITDDELLALQKDHENAILQLSIQTNKAVTEVLRAEIERRVELREDEVEQIRSIYSNIDLSQSEQYAEEVIALNNSLKAREVGIHEYNKRKVAIERKYSQQTIRNTISEIQTQLSLYDGKEGELTAKELNLQRLLNQFNAAKTNAVKDELREQIRLAEEEVKLAKLTVEKKIELLKKLAEAQKNLSNKTTSDDEDTDLEKRNELIEALQNFGAAANSLHDIENAASDRRIQKIEAEKKALEDKFRQEIEGIENSGLSEEEKQEKIAKAEKLHKAELRALEEKERQEKIKQAIFEKRNAMFNILLNTAVAVVRALPDTAKAFQAGALGAVQLAAAAAAPIPTFAKGTDSSPEGLALVGEAGRELAKEPGGKWKMYDGPTFVNLEKGTKIYPNRVTEKMLKDGHVTPSVAPIKPRPLNPIKAGLEPFSIKNLPENKRPKSLLELSREVKVNISSSKVIGDMARAAHSDVSRIISAPQKESRDNRLDKLIEETEKTNKELKQLNKKPPIAIIAHNSIELDPYYIQQMKY